MIMQQQLNTETKLIVSIEHRYLRHMDGHFYTNSAFGPDFWDKYLRVFSSVSILARGNQQTSVAEIKKCIRVDSSVLTVRPLPYYLGPKEFLLKLPQLIAVLRFELSQPGCVLLRIPSPIGALAYFILKKRKRSFGVEVVGDAYDLFAPNSIKHPLRPIFRLILTGLQKAICKNAVAASYVTRAYLQRRYPCAQQSCFISDVELVDDSFVENVTLKNEKGKEQIIVNVGSMEQQYKDQDTLIKAVGQCVKRGLKVRLILVGDGVRRSCLQQLADDLGIGALVTFTGWVPAGESVRKVLDQSDLFVLASLTEGLPRALLEAMARGLPCLGTCVGGIPELLDDKAQFPVRDVNALSDKILEILTDKKLARSLAENNLKTAKQFHANVLRNTRDEFYRLLKENASGSQIK